MDTHHYYQRKFRSAFSGYEYSRGVDTVDWSTIYEDWIWDSELLGPTGRELVDRYRSVDGGYWIGLEFDWGSKEPAAFFRFRDDGSNYDRLIGQVTDILGIGTVTRPDIGSCAWEHVGIMPGRGMKVVRLQIYGSMKQLQEVAYRFGATRNLNVIENAVCPLRDTCLAFNWDGQTVSRLTFGFNDPTQLFGFNDDAWSQACFNDALPRIAELYSDTPHQVSHYFKVGLTDDFPDDYLKLYFGVRTGIVNRQPVFVSGDNY